MPTDEFLREQVERSQQEKTRRRRLDRLKRRRVYVCIIAMILAMLVLAAPSLVSHSSIGRSLLTQAAGDYGLDTSVDSVRIGWLTPLRITGLRIKGESGESDVSIGQLDMDLTVTDLLSKSASQLGSAIVRDIQVHCVMRDGVCSLESDLAKLLDQPSTDDSTTTGKIELQEIAITIAEAETGQQWQMTQSNIDVMMSVDAIQATLAGVVTEPTGSGGSIQGEIELGVDEASPWHVDLQCESLPLSVFSLMTRRLAASQPEGQSTMPTAIRGDATGSVKLVGGVDGSVEASLSGFQVRAFSAIDATGRVWSNQLAIIDGDLALLGDRIVGRRLQAKTDFASGTLDGSMARSVSLTSSSTNPIHWLDTVTGNASAEIDLAAMDQAMPGLIPLRHGAELISGRATAQVQSLPTNGTGKRNQLILHSDELRARSHGRNVVIDPIEINAIVSTLDGQVVAEQFECTSSFANASGHGDLRSGAATFDIDFGRLSNMLRPIIEVSDSSLAGTATGNVRWNASNGGLWKLSGSGKASNLLITMPSGQSLQQPSLRGSIEAVGRWGGRTLDELSEANVHLMSTGLDIRADLTSPVKDPTSGAAMPLQVAGEGRIEVLAQTFAPWVPDQLQDAEGGFKLNARGLWASPSKPTAQTAPSASARIESATLHLTSPRVAYDGRHYSQPEVKVFFDGQFDLPNLDLTSRSLTVASEAFSLAASGTWNRRNIDLHANWKAKLERLQGSVRKQVAGRPDNGVRQVGYHPGAEVQTNDWLVMGDCEGDLIFKGNGNRLTIETSTTGKNIAVVQPPSASASTTGPIPASRGGSTGASRVVWYEPNLRLDGDLIFDASQPTEHQSAPQVRPSPTHSARVSADEFHIATDWLATSLSGHAAWNDVDTQLHVNGPAKLKMDEVAARLTRLVGTEIHAAGIQQTPIEINAVRGKNGHVAFSVLGNLGWEAADVAGVRMGPASIPVRMTETTVNVSPSAISVGQGQLNLAGDVHYRPGPVWFRAEPGRLAQSVRLTPDMTNRWLKYLAPLLADSTNTEGTFSVDVDEAIVVLDQPELSRVTGRLNIEGARMSAGPLANQIIGGIDQIKALGRTNVQDVQSLLALGAGGQAAQAGGNRTLINMPAQTVDFSVASGQVQHDRLYFEVDRAQIVTSGRVSMSGRLDMVAVVPLDARWLGNDLQAWAGQPVTLPIDGTISNPRLDSRGIRQVVSQLGVQAVQDTAENYLQKQLNRGLDKILGR